MEQQGLNRNALIIGLGSIGQRHLKNLHTLGYRNLFAVSSGKGTMKTDGLPLKQTFAYLDEALRTADPSVVFVCNPTSMHMQSALAAARAGAHIFLEKPIDTSLAEVQTLQALAAERQLCVCVGFQYRQHPVLLALRDRIRSGAFGRILSVRIHWGEYLPGWHPWEDYRKAYSAVAGLGGGVTFTLCHPLDYARWMLGEPTAVQATIHKTGGLEIDVDDVHHSTWHFADGVVASVSLDYLQRPGTHEMTIVGTRANARWNNADGCAVIYPLEGSEERISPPAGFERNDLFLAELRDFMDAVETGRDPFCTLDDGIANLEMVLGAFRASETGSTFLLSDKTSLRP